MKRLCIVVLSVYFGLCSTLSVYAKQEVKVGVIAPRGSLTAMKRWGELGKYLEKETGSPVKIIPLKVGEAVDAVKSNSVDYILSNPVQTVVIQKKSGAIPIATMKRKSGAQFAGVIIAKKGSGITKSADLKGKKVMGFKFKRSAAAYVFQVKHLLDQGIDPHKDFAVFKEAKKQDDIVLAVKSGLFDAGFIKSGLLEAMAKEGKIKLSDFEIVDKQTDSLTHLHSTILYPEWCFSASAKASGNVTDKIKSALFKMNENDSASKSAKIVGFVNLVSLDNLNATLKALHLPPYE